jgi:hypothetical protein
LTSAYYQQPRLLGLGPHLQRPDDHGRGDRPGRSQRGDRRDGRRHEPRDRSPKTHPQSAAAANPRVPRGDPRFRLARRSRRPCPAAQREPEPRTPSAATPPSPLGGLEDTAWGSVIVADGEMRLTLGIGAVARLRPEVHASADAGAAQSALSRVVVQPDVRIGDEATEVVPDLQRVLNGGAERERTRPAVADEPSLEPLRRELALCLPQLAARSSRVVARASMAYNSPMSCSAPSASG